MVGWSVGRLVGWSVGRMARWSLLCGCSGWFMDYSYTMVEDYAEDLHYRCMGFENYSKPF